MRKVFISYRHNTHKKYKDEIVQINKYHNLFIDMSINSGDIPDHLEDETIRKIIRDKKLKDSTVTLFLHGEGTNNRKFIDWELAGSMIDYNNANRSAIIIIDLEDKYWLSARNTEINDVTDNINFISITPEQKESRKFWKDKLPYAPERIIDNLIKYNVCINVMGWSTFMNNPYKLKLLIEKVARDREKNEYDTSRLLKKRNG